MQLLFLHLPFSEEVLRAVGWTLIHSLWQGLLAAVVAGIIIASTRRSSARIRYNLLGSVLFLFLITTIITFCLQNAGRAEEKAATGLTGTVTEISFAGTDYGTTPAKTVTVMDGFVNYFNTHADLFVLTWVIFFLIHCIKLLTGLAGIQRLRSYKAYRPGEGWQVRLDQLGKAIGIRQYVLLLESELIKIPVAAGYFKPLILVPLGLLSHLPADQVEAILLHELAHIRRKDYVINILQRFAEAVFFFNPALLWISSLIRQEREACCDDIVVANTHYKGSYLEALVSFQEYSMAGPGYAMAIASKKHYLLNRVKRMLTRENKKLNLMEKILLIAGLAAVTAFTFIPQKEIVRKKQLSAEGIKNAGNESVAAEAYIPVPASPGKQVVKKENKKTALATLSNVYVSDTVPVPSKEKAKTNYDDMKFPSISHSSDNDGKTKTEIITVTNEDGKRYTITKLNDKIVTLIVDGRSIPENEMSDYTPLLQKIDQAIEENRARRQKEMEMRKAEMLQRQQDMKLRMAEKQKEMEVENKERLKQRDEQLKQFEREKRMMEDKRNQMRMEAERNYGSRREEYMKQLELERRMLEDKRKQMMKEAERNNNSRKEEYMKQLDQERRMLEDKRKQGMKEAERNNNLRKEEYMQQLEQERRMLEDKRKQMMKEIENNKKRRTYLDSHGREIIKNDKRIENFKNIGIQVKNNIGETKNIQNKLEINTYLNNEIKIATGINDKRVAIAKNYLYKPAIKKDLFIKNEYHPELEEYKPVFIETKMNFDLKLEVPVKPVKPAEPRKPLKEFKPKPNEKTKTISSQNLT